MRPLEEVIQEANQVAQDPCDHTGCLPCERLRRELEEWEAKLVKWTSQPYGMQSTHDYEVCQLATIRKLLGRDRPDLRNQRIDRLRILNAKLFDALEDLYDAQPFSDRKSYDAAVSKADRILSQARDQLDKGQI